MKTLMIDVTNKVFAFLTYAQDLTALRSASLWNKPQNGTALLPVRNGGARA